MEKSIHNKKLKKSLLKDDSGQNQSEKDNTVSSTTVAKKRKSEVKLDSATPVVNHIRTKSVSSNSSKKVKINHQQHATSGIKKLETAESQEKSTSLVSSSKLLSALNNMKSNSRTSHIDNSNNNSGNNKINNSISRKSSPIRPMAIAASTTTSTSSSNNHTSKTNSTYNDNESSSSSGTSDGAYVNNRTIYVEGLPFASNEEEVRAFFQECCSSSSGGGGRIVSVRLPTWHDSGRLKGYGHVEFSNESTANTAFDLDGCDFLGTGRFVKIARPKVPRALASSTAGVSTTSSGSSTGSIVGCRTVFIKNLPYDVTEKQIQEVFQVCGPIVTVRLAVWNHTSTLKGFGYIEFKREDSATIAIKKCNKLMINDRPIFIDYDTAAAKGSYRPLLAAVDSNKKKEKKL